MIWCWQTWKRVVPQNVSDIVRYPETHTHRYTPPATLTHTHTRHCQKHICDETPQADTHTVTLTDAHAKIETNTDL